MYPEAIAETRTSIALNHLANGHLGMWLAKSGKRDEALKLLAGLKQESTRNYVQSYDLAIIYIGLRDKEEALNWLEKQLASRAETVSTFAVAPELDELRSEPRVQGHAETDESSGMSIRGARPTCTPGTQASSRTAPRRPCTNYIFDPGVLLILAAWACGRTSKSARLEVTHHTDSDDDRHYPTPIYVRPGAPEEV
jgi:hypothetical protein